jgi:uncharacterized membrane protein YkoI
MECFVKNKILIIPIFIFNLNVASAAKDPVNLILRSSAEDIAIKATPGKVKSSKIEIVSDLWVYSFDILGRDSKMHRILINAESGKVVNNKIEYRTQ